ncbi:MAG: YqgE/AlgH family protein [Aeromicrobium sp.]|jgi:putative transcriptional regulator|nr:YqgE/AlgH family protein [Aeromicrobium sp.]
MVSMDTLRGSLLVATPAIESGPFWRSVVFVLDHDADGALGVIVNHPLESDVDDVLPDWAGLVNAPVCLFDGGPVAMDSALALGVVADVPPPLGWRQMAGRVGLVDLDGPLPGSGELAGLRVFAGYAGWGPEQLESELLEGAWLVVQARDSDLTSPQPENLWRDVLMRQQGDVRFWATFPDDPSAN